MSNLELSQETLEYTIRFEAQNSMTYNKVLNFIGKLASKATSDKKFFYYHLDFSKNQIIRTNYERRTIELTNFVNPEIADLIANILNRRLEDRVQDHVTTPPARMLRSK